MRRKLIAHESCDKARISLVGRDLASKAGFPTGTSSARSAFMAEKFRYQDLEAWQQGMDLVERCYRASGAFPPAELYGITSQLRRAAVSIPSNVAEGHCRRTTGAYLNHLSIAVGSHGELETCLEIANRLGFLAQREFDALVPLSDSVGRLLNGLHRAIECKAATRRPGRDSSL